MLGSIWALVGAGICVRNACRQPCNERVWNGHGGNVASIPWGSLEKEGK